MYQPSLIRKSLRRGESPLLKPASYPPFEALTDSSGHSPQTQLQQEVKANSRTLLTVYNQGCSPLFMPFQDSGAVTGPAQNREV